MTSPVHDLISRWESRFGEAASRHGLAPAVIGQCGQDHLVLWTREAQSASRPMVYLSAGIHGDEPSGPLALLDFLESVPRLPEHYDWVIAPILNPSGLRAGIRENADGIDLNRDFLRLQTEEVRALVGWWTRRRPSSVVHFSLHEDWEAEGFYLYEINTSSRAPCGQGVLKGIADRFALQEKGPVDGHELTAPGLILHEAEPHEEEGWPEAIWLVKQYPALSLTFEAPGTQSLEDRRAVLSAALTAAVNGLDRLGDRSAIPAEPDDRSHGQCTSSAPADSIS